MSNDRDYLTGGRSEIDDRKINLWFAGLPYEAGLGLESERLYREFVPNS